LTDVSGRIVLQTQENINEGVTNCPSKAESGTYILKVMPQQVFQPFASLQDKIQNEITIVQQSGCFKLKQPLS
jgi:hypothetical protein